MDDYMYYEKYMDGTFYLELEHRASDLIYKEDNIMVRFYLSSRL